MKNLKIESKDLLILLEDFKSAPRQSFVATSQVHEIIEYFFKTQSNSATFVEDEKLKGVISKNDLFVRLSKDILAGKSEFNLSDYMITKPFVLSSKNTLLDAMMLMLKLEVTSVPIIDESDKKYLKTIDYNDILNWIIGHFEEYFKTVPSLEQWSYIDMSILENDFFEIEKGRLDVSFFSNTLQKVLIKNAFNIDEKTTFAEYVELASRVKGGMSSITQYDSLMKGIVTPAEVFRWFQDCDFRPDPDAPISKIMNVNYMTFMKKHSIALAISNMKNHHLEFLVIMDEDRYPMGIVRAFDILKFITSAIFYSEKDGKDRTLDHSA